MHDTPAMTPPRPLANPLDERFMSQAPVTLKRPLRWLAAAAVALLLVWFARVIVTNDNFQWPVVWKYLFAKEILAGVRLTIELTLTAMVIGAVLGVMVALMRLSDNRLLSSAAVTYTVVFR